MKTVDLYRVTFHQNICVCVSNCVCLCVRARACVRVRACARIWFSANACFWICECICVNALGWHLRVPLSCVHVCVCGCRRMHGHGSQWVSEWVCLCVRVHACGYNISWCMNLCARMCNARVCVRVHGVIWVCLDSAGDVFSPIVYLSTLL